MPTVRCFQMRLSVSRRLVVVDVLREALQKSSMKSSSVPWRLAFSALIAFSLLDAADLVLRHAVGQVAVDAARAEVGRVHARARHRLVHVEQVLALAEAVDEDVHRTAVQPCAPSHIRWFSSA
jgi:hypothetical protein